MARSDPKIGKKIPQTISNTTNVINTPWLHPGLATVPMQQITDAPCTTKGSTSSLCCCRRMENKDEPAITIIIKAEKISP
jgi:hypothetical protein